MRVKMPPGTKTLKAATVYCGEGRGVASDVRIRVYRDAGPAGLVTRVAISRLTTDQPAGSKMMQRNCLRPWTIAADDCIYELSAAMIEGVHHTAEAPDTSRTTTLHVHSDVVLCSHVRPEYEPPKRRGLRAHAPLLGVLLALLLLLTLLSL